MCVDVFSLILSHHVYGTHSTMHAKMTMAQEVKPRVSEADWKGPGGSLKRVRVGKCRWVGVEAGSIACLLA